MLLLILCLLERLNKSFPCEITFSHCLQSFVSSEITEHLSFLKDTAIISIDRLLFYNFARN